MAYSFPALSTQPQISFKSEGTIKELLGTCASCCIFKGVVWELTLKRQKKTIMERMYLKYDITIIKILGNLH